MVGKEKKGGKEKRRSEKGKEIKAMEQKKNIRRKENPDFGSHKKEENRRLEERILQERSDAWKCRREQNRKLVKVKNLDFDELSTQDNMQEK